jgi:hypothetical protein
MYLEEQLKGSLEIEGIKKDGRKIKLII